MKSFNLLVISIFFISILTVFSQNKNNNIKLQTVRDISFYTKYLNYYEKETNNHPIYIKQKSITSTMADNPDISKVEIASSGNIFGSIVSSSTCLYANPDINAIMFTHRAGGIHGGTLNDIYCTYSTDGGKTWGNVVKLIENGNNDTGVKNCRYPSGVFYYPTNASSFLNDAFIAVSGSNTIGLSSSPTNVTGWAENYYASARMNGTDKYIEYISIGNDSMQLFPRIGMTISNNGIIHVLGVDTLNKMPVLNTAKFNPYLNKFDWSKSVIKLNKKIRSLDIGMAWSEDGATGYIILNGRILNDTVNGNIIYNDWGTIMPLVYKTTDTGNTWKLFPIDISQIDAVTSHLVKPNSKPAVIELGEAVVDANNNLHLFCGVYTLSEIDSTSIKYWTPGSIYDIYTTSDSTFDVIYIETLYSSIIPENNNILPDVGWDHRIQASRTKDGNKVFCTWLDSYSTFSLEFPDIIGWGLDVNTKLCTPINNFTENTQFDGASSEYNHFIYTSEKVLFDNNFYIIPTTTTFFSNVDEPVLHFFFDGVKFHKSTFYPQNVKSLNKSNLTISKPYPNPCKDYCQLFITSEKPTKLNFYLYDITGNIIQSESLSVTNKKSITINLKNLPANIYFYQIHSGDKIYAGKIVKQ